MKVRRCTALIILSLLVSMLSLAGVTQAGAAGKQHASAGKHQHATRLRGVVLSVAGDSFQLQAISTMPVTITEGISTTITVAGISGTTDDIQSGRFVSVTGYYDNAQQTVDARRIEVLAPSISGRITALNGATFTLTSGRGIVYQVTTTATTPILARQKGMHATTSTGAASSQAAPASATLTVGERVTVVAFPPAAGGDAVTALRVWVFAAQSGAGSNSSSNPSA